MYYVWKGDFDYSAPDNFNKPEVWDEYSLTLGQEIPKDLPSIQFFFEKDGPNSDVVPNIWIYLLFNGRLVEFLKNHYDSHLFQEFPVEIIITSQEKKVENYYLMNILNTRDVIDFEKSDLDIDDGDIIGINHLEIIDEDFNNCDFFRLKGFSSLLICSQSFVDNFAENDFAGMRFIPLPEYKL
ncbi:MAG: hypothetical protein DHS20C18_34840 [Saprospiraceae bacterium]|nr:MAG: hypothetical protein DHS20C18_34840 [Saprospiraceae bacterium]